MIRLFIIIFFLFFIQNCEECNCDKYVNKIINDYGEPCYDVVTDYSQDGYKQRKLLYMLLNNHPDSLWVQFSFNWGPSVNRCCNYFPTYYPSSNLCSEDVESIFINKIDFEYENYNNNNCVSCP